MSRLLARQARLLERSQKTKLAEGGLDDAEMRQLATLSQALAQQFDIRRKAEKDIDTALGKLPDDKLKQLADHPDKPTSTTHEHKTSPK